MTKSGKNKIRTAEVQPAEPHTIETQHQNPKSNMSKIFGLIILIILLFFAYKIIDYYTGWGNTEKVIKRHIDDAEKSIIYKRYSSAIFEYNFIIKKWGGKEKYKDYVKQAKLSLAKTYKDSEQYISAIDAYKALINEYKDSNRDMYAWLLLELGDSYNSILNTEEAIRTYQLVIDEFKDSDWAAEAFFGIAEAYKSKKDYKNALVYYSTVVNKYQKGFLSAEAMTNMGKIYEQENNIKQAFKIYEKIIKDYPDIVTEEAKLRYDVLSQKLKIK